MALTQSNHDFRLLFERTLEFFSPGLPPFIEPQTCEAARQKVMLPSATGAVPLGPRAGQTAEIFAMPWDGDHGAWYWILDIGGRHSIVKAFKTTTWQGLHIMGFHVWEWRAGVFRFQQPAAAYLRKADVSGDGFPDLGDNELEYYLTKSWNYSVRVTMNSIATATDVSVPDRVSMLLARENHRKATQPVVMDSDEDASYLPTTESSQSPSESDESPPGLCASSNEKLEKLRSVHTSNVPSPLKMATLEHELAHLNGKDEGDTPLALVTPTRKSAVPDCTGSKRRHSPDSPPRDKKRATPCQTPTKCLSTPLGARSGTGNLPSWSGTKRMIGKTSPTRRFLEYIAPSSQPNQSEQNRVVAKISELSEEEYQEHADKIVAPGHWFNQNPGSLNKEGMIMSSSTKHPTLKSRPIECLQGDDPFVQPKSRSSSLFVKTPVDTQLDAEWTLCSGSGQEAPYAESKVKKQEPDTDTSSSTAVPPLDSMSRSIDGPVFEVQTPYGLVCIAVGTCPTLTALFSRALSETTNLGHSSRGIERATIKFPGETKHYILLSNETGEVTYGRVLKRVELLKDVDLALEVTVTYMDELTSGQQPYEGL